MFDGIHDPYSACSIIGLTNNVLNIIIIGFLFYLTYLLRRLSESLEQTMFAFGKRFAAFAGESIEDRAKLHREFDSFATESRQDRAKLRSQLGEIQSSIEKGVNEP